MLSVYTRPRKAQSVCPMITYEMPPQPRAHAMSRARGTALAKPTPCFSSYFGCAAAIPRVQRDAPWGGTTCQSRTALLMHHGPPAFLPILPCYTTRPRVPFEEEAFAGMPPPDGVLACSACCCRLYRLKPLKPIDGGMEEPGPKHDPLPQLLPLPLLPARIHV